VCKKLNNRNSEDHFESGGASDYTKLSRGLNGVNEARRLLGYGCILEYTYNNLSGRVYLIRYLK
jgi:hypothetical protein